MRLSNWGRGPFRCANSGADHSIKEDATNRLQKWQAFRLLRILPRPSRIEEMERVAITNLLRSEDLSCAHF